MRNTLFAFPNNHSNLILSNRSLTNYTNQILYIYIYTYTHTHTRASLIAQLVNYLPALQETQVRFLVQGDPLKKEMATQSSILAGRIPWTEEPGGLQSIGLPRAAHDLATKPPPYIYINTHTIYIYLHQYMYIYIYLSMSDIYHIYTKIAQNLWETNKTCWLIFSSPMFLECRFDTWSKPEWLDCEESNEGDTCDTSFPGGSVVKNLPAKQYMWVRSLVRKIPGRRKRQPVFLPGKSHRQRTLAGYSPYGHKKPDTT